jgi:hypothetical protein
MKGNTMETILTILSLVGAFIAANAFLIGLVSSLTLSAILAVKGEAWIEALMVKYPKLAEDFDEPQTVFSLIRNLKKN